MRRLKAGQLLHERIRTAHYLGPQPSCQSARGTERENAHGGAALPDAIWVTYWVARGGTA
jgi:hypothetical protein